MLCTYKKVRFKCRIDISGTFKLQKNLLQEEGFNPTKIEDPMFFLDTKAGSYVKLDEELYQNIVSGAVRL